MLPTRPKLVLGPPSRPAARPAQDPWEHASASAPSVQEQLHAVSAALHVTLAILAEQRPGDPALAEARRGVAAIQVRHAVQEARDHELGERWLPASRAWMRAALVGGDDAWLFAHAARTLLLTNASSRDAVEVARRALGLDPANPLAARVLDRARG